MGFLAQAYPSQIDERPASNFQDLGVFDWEPKLLVTTGPIRGRRLFPEMYAYLVGSRSWWPIPRIWVYSTGNPNHYELLDQ